MLSCGNICQKLLWCPTGKQCFSYYENKGLLTHLPLGKMATIWQTTFPSAFSWMKILVFWFKFHWSLFLKPLSHQGGIVTATARRARKIQNSEVRAVGSPRSLRDRRGISTACRGVSKDAMPWHAFCACTKCAPWLGVPTAFWMSAMGTPWFRSGNVVTAQWGLLERHEDTVCTQRGRTWSPQEHRCIVGGGVCTATSRSV